MQRVIWVILVVSTSCGSSQLIQKRIRALDHDLQQHSGFALYDPQQKKMLVQHQADKYFTPASNTKIFTLYTALQVLGDSAIAFRYQQRNDSLVIWGMGDPSFLNSYVMKSPRVYDFLKSHPGKIYLSNAHFTADPLGPGWGWSEYQYSYQPERSAFPMYSNLLTLQKTGADIHTTPRWFSNMVVVAPGTQSPQAKRALDSNEIIVSMQPKTNATWEMPFRVSDDLVAELLADTLKKTVEPISLPMPRSASVFHSIPLDSIYKVMMQESDNFLAEQLLLQCAAVVSDTLDSQIAMDYAQKYLLTDLPDKPRWVDGSGLSRYNLFTPRSIIRLWEKIAAKKNRDQLFPLLATGGVNGTVRQWYKGSNGPYVYGKTGTLSNNHSLSGFLITKKGRILIFSIMNNNFTAPTAQVRTRMQELLELIRDTY